MDDEHIRVARWMRRVEPGEVDASDGGEPFPLLDVEDFGNDGEATDGSGSEAKSDGGRLPGAIRGFGAVLDENGNPNGWFGPTGQFRTGLKDQEQGAAEEDRGEATSGVGLGENAGRMEYAARIYPVLIEPESSPKIVATGQAPKNEMEDEDGEDSRLVEREVIGVQFSRGDEENEHDKDNQPVKGKGMETNASTATMPSPGTVTATRMKPSLILYIKAYESTGEEDDKELLEGKDMQMTTPTVRHAEHLEERPESPLKRKRLE